MMELKKKGVFCHDFKPKSKKSNFAMSGLIRHPPKSKWFLYFVLNWKNHFAAIKSKEISSKTLFALIDQSIVSVTNFGTSLIIGRLCSKEQFGLYMLGISVVTLITNIQTFLVTAPYTIYYPHLDQHKRSTYLGSTLIHHFHLSALFILLLQILRMLLSLIPGPDGLPGIINTLSLTIGFILFREYIRRICFATLKIAQALFLDSFVIVLQIGGLILLVHYEMLSPQNAYYIIGFAACAAVVYWYVHLRTIFNYRFSQIYSDLSTNFKLGRWILCSGLIWQITSASYPWLLASFHGTSSTGAWAACYSITTIINPVFLGLQNFLGPKIAHTYAHRGVRAMKDFLFQVNLIYIVVIMPFCILLIAFGDQLVILIYGNKFSGNGLVVTVLAINLIISALLYSPVRALFTLERADADFKLNLIYLFVLILFGLPIVYLYGIVGAACSLFLSNLLCLIGKNIFLHKYILTLYISRFSTKQKNRINHFKS